MRPQRVILQRGLWRWETRSKRANPSWPLCLLDDIWITANYKETQLEKVNPGQKVENRSGHLSWKSFLRKSRQHHVRDRGCFLSPSARECHRKLCQDRAENTVKIILDKGTDPGHILRIGMSVVPTILIDSN